MATSQKILICGFPHCGTSILKSILGHIEDVEEIYDETPVIDKISNKKFISCKYPFTDANFFGENWADYIKIFIIRNPLFVFSSLNKRFNYEIPICHSFENYIETLQLFIKYKNNPEKNIYTIKYEDLFDNNYEKFKTILIDIGITYKDDRIFDNSKYTNIVVSGVELLEDKPENIYHNEYRTWQINQPFISNNDISKLDLSTSQIEEIINNKYVLEIYPDISIAVNL